MSGTLRICTQVGSNLVYRNGTQLKQRTQLLPVLSSRTSNLVTVANQSPENGFIKTTPFPYKTKRYTSLHVTFPILDSTHFRMNKNSKIVCIEGNIGSKKAEFAKNIAQAFGLHYMPEPRIDDMYVNHDGFDYRTLNKYIHPKLHAIDEKMYYEDPHHPGVPWMKIFFYKIRYIQYIDALTHMLNTGQGIVLERCPHSDFVFADAMHSCGYLPKDAYDYYYRLRYDTIHELKRPHLVIYFDTDIDVCMKHIKEKDIPYQTNSKVLTKKYLNEIENSYKQKYLEDADKYSELLIFKWNESARLDDIISEIENANLDDWDIKEDKFCDWNLYLSYMLHEVRYKYTSEKYELIENFSDTPVYDVDSLNCDIDDYNYRDEIYKLFVPNYGVLPEISSQKSFIKTLFLLPFRDVNFELRSPFY